MRDDLALVQTVDFFAPIVDDLSRDGIERNLTGGEEEAIRDHGLRVRADGRGRLVGVQ